MSKWLCKIGLHKYGFIGFVGLSLSDSLYMCSRCGCGKAGLCFGMATARQRETK